MWSLQNRGKACERQKNGSKTACYKPSLQNARNVFGLHSLVGTNILTFRTFERVLKFEPKSHATKGFGIVDDQTIFIENKLSAKITKQPFIKVTTIGR